MSEQKQNIRPTKKQRELLSFIEQFIMTHGYSPSYREIMAGCNYTSVATVSLHVNNLIKRGHLVKREHNARSIEVVKRSDADIVESAESETSHEQWLLERVEQVFLAAEQDSTEAEVQSLNLQTLIRALDVLGFESEAEQYALRLQAVEDTKVTSEDVPVSVPV